MRKVRLMVALFTIHKAMHSWAALTSAQFNASIACSKASHALSRGVLGPAAPASTGDDAVAISILSCNSIARGGTELC